ncbi:MAG: hypothetical protein AAFZ17_01900 [Cyanobacteria bacterium J06650_10]
MRRRRNRKTIILSAVVITTICLALSGIGRWFLRTTAAQEKGNAIVEAVEVVNFGEQVDAEDLPCDLWQVAANNGPLNRVASLEHATGHWTMWSQASTNASAPQIYVSKILENGLCVLPYTPAVTHITDTVPLEVARALTFQYIEVIAESQGGMDAYKANILRSFEVDEHAAHVGEYGEPLEAERDIPLIDSVILWAYEAHGIELPEGSYEVLDIDNEWDYAETSDPLTGAQRL